MRRRYRTTVPANEALRVKPTSVHTMSASNNAKDVSRPPVTLHQTVGILLLGGPVAELVAAVNRKVVASTFTGRCRRGLHVGIAAEDDSTRLGPTVIAGGKVLAVTSDGESHERTVCVDVAASQALVEVLRRPRQLPSRGTLPVVPGADFVGPKQAVVPREYRENNCLRIGGHRRVGGPRSRRWIAWPVVRVCDRRL